MKTLFTLLSLLSLSSVFAAEPACSDAVVDKVSVRKCTDAAACTADKGAGASFKDGVCFADKLVSTKCPEGVEAGRSTAAAAATASKDGATGTGVQGK